MTAKHAMFFALFTQGRVSVTLDARRPGVLLPEPLLRYPILVLDYGMALPNPTADIHLEEAGIRCTLSFNQTPTATFVPWAAIYALAGATGGIQFTEDTPPEVASAAAALAAGDTAPGKALVVTGRPRFELVPPEADAQSPVGDPGPARPAPALSIVKVGPAGAILEGTDGPQ